ncbi:DNA primase [Arcanobacterium haemolyticum]|uniref:DNA primase n=2 Tax=Arcanobacterium haemolyticum TaxID=28264 RepID=D7BND5_ARCHD|nr:DNA primase [Arcanobacterium haemolyticum DSM 20595]SQH28837.1 DNA primase [Arcanobacterium haemolyticum]
MIKRSVIDDVREKTRIEDVVGEYVTLKTAGVGSMKGLCPFHDEKTPSFHVRPHVNRWHCFGCGEGGDAISFIERIEHVTFVEAIELLARKAGVVIEYEENGNKREESGPRDVTRTRLIDAHRVAEEFYVQQLATDAGEPARKMLAERGFSPDVIAEFRVGYSPDSWDGLLTELRRRGFSDKEISASGLASQKTRGLYDRFRGRVMWPIRSITGDPIGFGARKLFESDQGPKYLNTPETMIYKKSGVLYGLDLAKKAISSERAIVVVEGYTDVMAAHIAGVKNAVATCGTAFGSEHVKIVRRLMGDSANPAAGVMMSNGRAFGGEVIFTFDGDAAGQKAALRAFQEDQSFAAQTFVAVSEGGMDPCELRMAGGDAAVRDLIARRRPLFEFAIRSLLDQLPLRTVEGRAAGLRAAAPIVAQIRDRVLQSEYSRQLAGWLGMDEALVRDSVRQAGRSARYAGPVEPDEVPRPQPVLEPRNLVRDPVARVERQALEVMLQLPGMAAAALADQIPSRTFRTPIHQSVFDAISAAGGVSAYVVKFDQLSAAGMPQTDASNRASTWFVEQVENQADDLVKNAVRQFAVEPLPENDEKEPWPYVRGIILSLIRQGIVHQIADLRREMRMIDADSPRQNELFEMLMKLEATRRAYDEAD